MQLKTRIKKRLEELKANRDKSERSGLNWEAEFGLTFRIMELDMLIEEDEEDNG